MLMLTVCYQVITLLLLICYVTLWYLPPLITHHCKTVIHVWECHPLLSYVSFILTTMAIQVEVHKTSFGCCEFFTFHMHIFGILYPYFSHYFETYIDLWWNCRSLCAKSQKAPCLCHGTWPLGQFWTNQHCILHLCVWQMFQEVDLSSILCC